MVRLPASSYTAKPVQFLLSQDKDDKNSVKNLTGKTTQYTGGIRDHFEFQIKCSEKNNQTCHDNDLE